MKDIGAILRYHIEHNGIKQVELATKTGYSKAHLWQLLQRDDLTCSQLERFCNATGLSPLLFFDIEISDSFDDNNFESPLASDNYTLSKIIKEKDERIKVLEKNVSLLEDLLKLYRDGNGTNDNKKAS